MTSWRVDVTNADITAARDAWDQAEATGEEPERIARLWADVERLCRTQAWQLLGDLDGCQPS